MTDLIRKGNRNRTKGESVRNAERYAKSASRSKSGVFATLRPALALFALLAFLLVAPAAQGKVLIKNVESPRSNAAVTGAGGFFGSSGVGGGGPGGGGVNSTGAGGVGPGDYYTTDTGQHRVQHFDADGNFIEAWGWDVVQAGTGNNNAIQSLTVRATGGQFKLTFGANTTPDLPYNATAAEVQTALEGLPSIGPGNIRVTGGPGDLKGTVPYGIFFAGTLGGSARAPVTASNGTTPLSGGAASATVLTINAGGVTGFEVCKAGQSCKVGVTSSSGLGGGMSSPQGLAIDRSNGNVYVSESGFNRIQEFTAAGVFVRAFGRDVVATGKPENEVATAAKQTLTISATEGQFTLEFEGKKTSDLAFDATAAQIRVALEGLSSIGLGNVTVASGGAGIHAITFANALRDTPLPLIVAANGTIPLGGGGASALVANTTTGKNDVEVCAVPANCKAGIAGATGGALGSGVGYLAFAPAGAPNAGDVLVADPGNARVQEFTGEGAFVRAFGWDAVFRGLGDAAAGVSEQQTLTIKATAGTFNLGFDPGIGSQTTGQLKYNASAAEVEAALNGLSNVATMAAKITVSGGPGDAGGTSPYVLSFGGSLAGDDVNEVTANSTGLLEGARTATVATTQPGGGEGFEICRRSAFDICKTSAPGSGTGQFAPTGPNSIAEGAEGSIYTVERAGTFRVQKFTLPSNVVTPQGPFAPAVLTGTNNAANTVDNPVSVAVDGAGNVLVVKGFSWEGECMEAPSKPLEGYAATITPNENERRIVELTSSGELLDEHATCDRLDTGAAGTNGVANYAVAVDSSSGRIFLNSGDSRGFYIVDDEPGLAASFDSIDEIAGTSATLHGTIDPAGRLGYRTQYHFEYQEVGDTIWRNFPEEEKDDPNLGNGSGSGSPESCPVGNPPVCEVEQVAEGLRPETTYHVRLVAYTHFAGTTANIGGGLYGSGFNGAYQIVNAEDFTTAAAPPAALTGRARWTAAPEREPSLIMEGVVNPGGVRTTYRFEFVTQSQFEASGFADARSAPAAQAPPAEAGHGIIQASVRQVVNGLDPTVAYHYRLAASNENGPGTGEGRTIAPPDPSERFYELVSPGDSEGLHVALDGISPGGDLVGLYAEALDPTTSLPTIVNLYGSERKADGWSVFHFDPEPTAADAALGLGGYPALASPDLNSALLQTADEGAGRGEMQFTLAHRDGSLTPSGPRLVPIISPASSGIPHAQYSVIGGSPDFSTYVFTGPPRTTLLPGEEPVFQGAFAVGNTYQITGANGPSPVLSQLALTTGGQKIGGGCAPDIGSASFSRNQAISYDGSVVQFTVNAGHPAGNCSSEATFRKRIFKRVNAATTVEVSASECNRVANLPALPACETSGPSGTPLAAAGDEYRDASADGSMTFFTTTRQLVNSDVDATNDLYVYDDQARNEIQKLNVAATAGAYTLSAVTGRATGTTASGSKNVTGVTVTGGSLNVGDAVSGAGIPAGATIAAVAAGIVELSTNATAAGSAQLVAVETTAPVAFDAPAAGAGSVQEKLTALPGVGADGVAVSGGGGEPFLVEFAGSAFAGKPQPPLRLGTGSLTGTATEEAFVSGGHLTQVSAGTVAPGHPVVGSGAGLLDPFGGTGASMDGSRIYFVATGRLTADATEGAKNLYAYERDAANPHGRLHFIAVLGASDNRFWEIVIGGGESESGAPAFVLPFRDEAGEPGSGDGHILVFNVATPLLPEDTDSQRDVYRYDDSNPAEPFTCLTCAGNGAFRVETMKQFPGFEPSAYQYENQARVVSEDGRRLAFMTPEGLSPEDTNGAEDVYESNNGQITLVSGGLYPTDLAGGEDNPAGSTSRGPFISADGHDLFFVTQARLLPADGDSALDVYDARIGGGFTAQSTETTVCKSGEECHGSGADQPPPETPASAASSGPGNPPVAAAPRKCRKGKVRRHGVCVKKDRHPKKHRAHRRAQRAGLDRGGVK